MATIDTQLELSAETPAVSRGAPEPEFRPSFVEVPSVPVSLFRQILALLREPKITVPQKYYRGAVKLPVTEMPPWYRDLPNQLRALFEKPQAPSIPLTSKPIDLPDIWQDYRLQPGSWVNSVLVHVIGITIMVLPFVMARLAQPVKAANKYAIVDISPYLAELPGNAKRTGGGGGGGDRSPTPASKGAIPKFAKQQLAPPMAVIPNMQPQLPVQASLLGPPELKLPEMQANMPWGDPHGVLGPLSNGPGTGGGIGSGEGTGIGSGKGGGLGPGEGGGTGGGAFSVGGSVTAPIPIYKPEPPYSEEARKAKFQGTVVLLIVVDTQGNVADIRTVKPLGLGLDEKAVDTVRTWKFKPGTRNGVPVPVRVYVEVSFRLF
jgi:TonB family protein